MTKETEKEIKLVYLLDRARNKLLINTSNTKDDEKASKKKKSSILVQQGEGSIADKWSRIVLTSNCISMDKSLH